MGVRPRYDLYALNEALEIGQRGPFTLTLAAPLFSVTNYRGRGGGQSVIQHGNQLSFDLASASYIPRYLYIIIEKGSAAPFQFISSFDKNLGTEPTWIELPLPGLAGAPT